MVMFFVYQCLLTSTLEGGIGKYTADELAAAGADVTLACRNVDAANTVARWIRGRHPQAKVQVLQLDLADNVSIRDFADKFKAQGKPLHILVNNAGTNFLRPWHTPEGIAGLTQVNFLGPFLLTRLLLPSLKQGAPSKIVNVSSITHRMPKGFPNIDDFLRDFRTGNYAATKLANVLFTFESQRRYHAQGISSVAVDPGGVNTNIWKNSGKFSKPPFSYLIKSTYATPADAAKVVVDASLGDHGVGPKGTQGKPVFLARGFFASRLITNTKVWDNKTLLPIVLLMTSLDYPVRVLSGGLFNSRTKEVRPSDYALDENVQKELWRASSKAVGLPAE
eukprot:jgi/Mesvir1/2018/Mv06198-RA.2